MRSTRLAWTVIVVFSLAFLLFVVFYQRYALSRVKHNIAEHVAVIAPFLWNYDENYGVYLTLAAQAHTYAELAVQDNRGHESLSIEGPPPTRYEQWLMTVKLMPLYQFQEEIHYSGKKLGTLLVTWRCTTIYTYNLCCHLFDADCNRYMAVYQADVHQHAIRNAE